MVSFLILIMEIISTAITGLVFMAGWNWFVHPLGVVEIEIWQSLGISSLIAMFVVNLDTESDEEYIRKIVIQYIFMGLTFALMWFYQFMM